MAATDEVIPESAFKVGARVKVGQKGDVGVVKYTGATQFAGGLWIGIELDESEGKNDGSVKGVKYFDCRDMQGIFVRETMVTLEGEDGAASPASPKAASPKRAATKELVDPKADPKAAVPKRTATMEKAAAPKRVATKEKDPVVDDGTGAAPKKKAAPKAKADDGTGSVPVAAEGEAAKPKRTVTAEKKPAKAPAKAAAADPEGPPPKPELKKSTTGFKDEVDTIAIAARGGDDTDSHEAFKNNQRLGMFSKHGVVRFVGATSFADGIWIGIEFDEPIGKCDGSLGGKRYFSCNRDHGVFLLAPSVDRDAVEVSAGASERARAASGLGRRMSFGKHAMRSQKSGFSEEVEVASGHHGVQILDDEGNTVDIEQIIHAFEETRDELEGIQELLQESQDREMQLRKKLQLFESGAGVQDALRPKTAELQRSLSKVGTPAPVVVMASSSDLDNIILLTDSYKVTHHLQYPPKTEIVYSYFESRGGQFEEVCFFGLQYFIKKYLVGQVVTMDKITQAGTYFRSHFSHPVFGYDNRLYNRNAWEHIVNKHEGRLPISIRSVPEGTIVPYKNVLFTLENTDPKCFWLTNYLETLLVQVWYPSTVCTQSLEQKKIIKRFLTETGSADVIEKGLDKFKLHDFGFRGVSSVESSALGGVAHLVNFLGTDTMSAIIMAREYYDCDCAGFSIPASEHSTITSWGKSKENDAMRNMLDMYPKGLVACVSDSYDIWNACENIWGTELKAQIEKREGCLVVRPDSGELPITVLKVLEKLESKFGSSQTTSGHKLLPPYIRVIQGDGIDIKSLEVILEAMKSGGWAADNLAFGSGGALLQKLHRDTQKVAFKCSSIRIDGKESVVYKDPITDAGKKSKLGRLSLERGADGKLTTITEGKGDPTKDQLVEVFRDGKLLIDDTLAMVRRRSEGQWVQPKVAVEKKEGLTTAGRGKPPGAAPPPRRTATSLNTAMKECKGLSDGLLDQLGKLKKVQETKEKREVLDADVALVVEAAKTHGNDLEKLARLCGVPKTMFDKKKPKDAEEFARLLLSGQYTGDKTELAKAGLKQKLKDGLEEAKGGLKRTTTKEASGEASPEECAAVAGIWAGASGDIEKLSSQYGLSLSKLQADKPKDGMDFAKKLFAGAYTADAGATAMADLRKSLKDQLHKSMSTLKRTTTKENGGASADPEDIARVAALYTKNRGNLDQLARICGASISLMRKYKPEDENDFAKKLLEGMYTGDSTAMAKAELRDRLKEDLQASSLKRTTTKEAAQLSPEEIDAVAKFYTEKKGDLQAIAKALQMPEAIFNLRPPADAREFAVNLLGGTYTTIDSEVAKRTLREDLLKNLSRKDTLKRVETRSGGIQLSDIELDFAGKIYTEKKGNYEEIAQTCGISVNLLKKYAPTDARTFAKALFDGIYSAEQSDEARKDLRDKLKQDLQSQLMKLKPAAVQEKNKAAGAVELTKFAAVYTKHRGQPEKLAQQFGLNADLLKKSPPTDANDFAKKLLDGVYTGESSEIAKAMLREQMRDALQRQVSVLKRTTTKEKALTGTSSVSQEDVLAFAGVFTKEDGNLVKLVPMFHLEKELVEANPPKNAEDFAFKLLSGAYTGEKSELQRKFLLKRLKGDLESTKGSLKRTTTKERQMNDVNEDDVKLIAKVYTACKGDLKLLAQKCAIPLPIVSADKPKDAEDFAKKMLLGNYHRDMPETAKKKLRDELVKDAGVLQRTASTLKRTTTKEATGEATPEDIKMVTKLYNDKNGNLEKLAKLTGSHLELMRKNPPADAEDFAKKLLSGLYSGENAAMAMKNLREALKEDIQEQAGKLKRTTTKEATGEPTKDDIAAIKKVYDEKQGNLAAIAELLGVPESALKKTLPKNGEEFAINLLKGLYTAESAEAAKAGLRKGLLDGLQKTQTSLKRTTTKEAQGDASPEEIKKIAEYLASFKGDYDKMAGAMGVDKALILKDKPANDEDFAKKLLAGAYTGDSSETAKAKLRKRLAEDLQRNKSFLKRTTTKEAQGAASEEDIVFFTKVWEDNRGRFDKLAKCCGCTIEIIKKNPPANGEDFAKRLLAGQYTGEAGAMAIQKLRQDLRVDLQSAKTELKRTRTKEATGAPSKDDLKEASKLFTKNKGDLAAISKTLQVPVAVLEKNKPANADEFAMNLLTGKYSVEQEAMAAKTMRDNLAGDLGTTKDGLKRTTTKESGISSEDSAAIAAMTEAYDKEGMTLVEKLTESGCILFDLFDNNPPKDSRDFAVKLLSGVWSGDKSDAGRKEMRKNLAKQLQRTATSLKRVATKESKGETNMEDIAAIAQVYSTLRGKLEKLAETFGADLALLKSNPPSTAEDFAQKLLEGSYTGDGTEAAKKALRSRLRDDLKKTATSLKRTATKEGTGPKDEDLDRVAQVYRAHGGDLELLGALLGPGAQKIMEEHPPKDAMDFAGKVLRGEYTVDAEANSRAYWRDNLSEDISGQKGKLKRVATKESQGEASSEDVKALAKIYEQNKFDTAKLCEFFGIVPSVLERNAPRDAEEFAKNLLMGKYNADASEAAKTELRGKLKDALEGKIVGLKRTTTKEANGEASPEDIAVLAQLWHKHGGNLALLAKRTGVLESELVRDGPQSGEEFAKKLLMGNYSGDRSDAAKRDLRNRLRVDLAETQANLRRTNTREGPQRVMEDDQDLLALAQVFEKNRGKYPAIIEAFKNMCPNKESPISLELLQKVAPKTGREFARGLLDGLFTPEASEAAKAGFRKGLMDGLKGQKGHLKRTTTKEAQANASPEDIACAAKLWLQHGGELDKLAEVLNVNVSILNKTPPGPPKSADEFAKRLLAGEFSAEMSDAARGELRKNLKDALGTQLAGLKRTTTKEVKDEVPKEILEKFGKFYTECRGNYQTLATKVGAKVELIKANQPVDHIDFAKKLLAGLYTVDNSEAAKRALRDRLAGDITTQKAVLKRTETKEGGGPMEEDILAASAIFTQHNGDLLKICAQCGIPQSVLEKDNPKDPMDFAKKLLAGVYSKEMTPVEKEELKKAIAEQFKQQQKLMAEKPDDKGTRGHEATPQQIMHIEKLYLKHQTDLEHLAKICGLTPELLTAEPPKDATEFATKLLAGRYSMDAFGVDKEIQLRRQLSKLNRVPTKESSSSATASDVDVFAKLYTRNEGDLARLSKALNVPVQVLEKNAPKNAQDFAKKLLEGVYAHDQTSVAQDQLRKALKADIARTATSLKRTTTKEAAGTATQAEIDAVIEVLKKEYALDSPTPDFKLLAQKFGLSLKLMLKLMEENKDVIVQDHRRFAVKILAGHFSEDANLAARADFRSHLRDKLSEMVKKDGQDGKMKRTTTKEARNDANDEELKVAADLYTNNQGDFDKLAKVLNVPVMLFDLYPPEDAMDFARKLFKGVYTPEGSGLSREQLRKNLATDLHTQKNALKRTATKESTAEATVEDVSAVAQLYTYYVGNLDDLARHTGSNVELMRANPPSGAEDFAKKLLLGDYSGDTSDLARSQLRMNLQTLLAGQTGQLKRTTTKEGNAGPEAHELKFFADIFTNNGGDHTKIAAALGIDVEQIKKDKPTDANTFAAHLLEGRYSSDQTAAGKLALRKNLKESVASQAGNLKRTTTKEASGEASAEDIAALKKVYDDNGKELKQLVEKLGIAQLLADKKPKDGTEFAKNLLSGLYSADQSEGAKKNLRAQLKDQLGKGSVPELKRTATKEAEGKLENKDIAFFADVYDQYQGDLDKLAVRLGANIELMRKFRPSSKTDFARKLLSGQYNAEVLSDEMKAALNGRFRQEITRTMSSLKRVATKEGGTELTVGDLASVEALWNRFDGNFGKIAKFCDISEERLTRAAPANYRIFAKGLLSGAFTEDATDAAKLKLRDRLREDLALGSAGLKRTRTREATVGQGPSLDEIKYMAQLYAQHKGNLTIIAKLIGIEPTGMLANPPTDGEDFARHVLAGDYTKDWTEAAKAELRNKLTTEITSALSGLKRTATKDLTGQVFETDIAQFAKIWDNNGGDLAKIAELCKIDVARLVECKDGKDFAKKLLEGQFTGETSDFARKALRDRLKDDLQSKLAGLRKTTTKTYSGPSNDDLVMAGAVWEKYKGASGDDLALRSIAKIFCASAELMKQHPPANKEDFAKKMLAGFYTVDQQAPGSQSKKKMKKLRKNLKKKSGDSLPKSPLPSDGKGRGKGQGGEKPKKPYRESDGNDGEESSDSDGEEEDAADVVPLSEGIKQQESTLRRTATKEKNGELAVEDVQALVAVYTKYNGDLVRLAEVCEMPLQVFKDNPPKDGRDWAVKMLEGSYQHDGVAKSRQDFKKTIEKEIGSAMAGLKRTTTKEGTGGPSFRDLDAASKIWIQCKGDPKEISKRLKIPEQVLKMNWPQDAADFAKKLLSGAFEAQMDDVAKADFRKQLVEANILLKRQATLTRVATKTGDGKATEDDIAMVKKIWDKFDGDLKQISDALTIPMELFDKDYPDSAETFARNLLEGKYNSTDVTLVQKHLREKMIGVLGEGKMPELKRTETKTYTGAPKPEEIRAVREVYDKAGGDLQQLSNILGLSFELLRQHPPENGEDFAKNCLAGKYTSETSEEIRKRLGNMKDEMTKAIGGLKRTTTKEGATAASTQDVEAMARVFREHGADLAKLAAKCGLDVELLRKRPPADDKEFAARCLKGEFSAT